MLKILSATILCLGASTAFAQGITAKNCPTESWPVEVEVAINKNLATGIVGLVNSITTNPALVASLGPGGGGMSREDKRR